MNTPDKGYQELLEEISTLKKKNRELERLLSECQSSDDTLRESEEKYRFIAENTAEIIRILDADLRCVYVSPSVSRIRGVSVEEALHETAAEIFPPEFLPLLRSIEGEALQTTGTADPDKVRTLEAPVKKKDGSLLWMEIGFSVVRNKSGALRRIITVARDISERKKLEKESRESEQALRTIFDNTHDAIFIHNLEGRILDCNQRTLDLYGVTREQALSLHILHDFSSLDNQLDQEPDRWDRLMKGETFKFEWKAKRPNDGSVFDVDIALKRINLAIGTVVLSNVRDITKRKAAEAALRESEETFRALVENCGDGIIRFDRNHRYLYINRFVIEHMGIPASPEDFIGRSFGEMGVPLDLCDLWHEILERGFVSGEVIRHEFQLPNGRWQDAIQIPEKDASGKVKSIIATVRDITENKKNAILFQSLFEAAPLGILVVDANRVVTLANGYNVPAFGYSPEEIVGRNARLFYFSDEEYQAAGQALRSADYEAQEIRLRRKDGGEAWVLMNRAYLNGKDNSAGMIVISLDITARKALEEQLRQAQKMEAIGQLAGGVAHDFNNILQAILGYTQMIMLSLKPDDKNWGKLEEVAKAGEKAATLTRQLLAFSRCQVLQLSPLDLNQIVEELMKMLHRLIGEHIDLIFMPDSELGPVNADRIQMEQVIINLCVNARDAMHEGGRLSIETKSIRIDDDYCTRHDWAKPGRYVQLDIMDSGCGMDQETKSKIFDPFFTTKEQGRGTGLGLATVYGIVRQHEGMIHVYSEIGRGSLFRIYLPVTEQAKEEIQTEPQVPPPGGHETILLAEDDEPLRFLDTEVLKLAGYRVLAAVDGEDAVRLYREHAPEIDLLLLDVVMPRKGGRAAYDEICTENPAVRCLFMSGYSENALHTNFILDQEFQLIQKPFKSADLPRIVRHELDRP